MGFSTSRALRKIIRPRNEWHIFWWWFTECAMDSIALSSPSKIENRKLLKISTNHEKNSLSMKIDVMK